MLPTAAQPTPRLTRRFAAYAALALAVAAAAIFILVREGATAHAERSAKAHARFVANSIVRDRLTHADFRHPVTGARLAELDTLFRYEVLVGGALRVKLYDPHGMVVYSNDHTLIGRRSPAPDEISRAAHGALVGDVTQLNSEGGMGRDRKVLESYVPVHLGRSGPADGVLELYTDYGGIAADARSDFLPLGGLVALVLMLLYLSFFPILRRTTSRLRRQVAQIEHQAYHDALTGLPNRTLFAARVADALERDRAAGTVCAVMLIDLDRFKEVNDTLGHRSGDELLCEVGRKLRALAPPGGTVARLGGDEFGILAPDIGDAAEAVALADGLRHALVEPQRVAGVELEVDASVGIALFPAHGEDVETLLQHADVAMYASKEGRLPAVYSPAADHYSPERLALMSQLRRAIAHEELVVHYQPQADLRDGAVRRVEALVRWQHPERGLLAPDSFVPLAEHIGVIRPLTLYVLDCALAQVRRWRDEGLDIGVAVNVTGRDLLDLRLPEEVRERLERWDVPPDRLELEITENTVLTDPLRAREVLDRLSRIGVPLAIDDFGSGNSSLGYLKRLPVSVLKIDKSFVLNMLEDEDDAVIVRSTIELGHNLGLSVVAEGVEDEAAWLRLGELGCDTAQGFGLGRPGPPEAIRAMVGAFRPAPPPEAAPAPAPPGSR